MKDQLPVFDVPKYEGGVAGGALAAAMSAAKRPLVDLRDLPNPPLTHSARKPS